MKHLLATTLLCGMAAGSAFAGSPAPAPADTVIPTPAPVVRDWSGFYAGLSASQTGGDMHYNNIPVVYDFNDDTAIGAFLGMNFQSGNLVYGAEVGLPNTNNAVTDFPQETLDSLIEARARLGYAMGDALIYGFVGYAQGTFTIPILPAEWDVSGLTYGAGVDYAIGERFFVGGAVSIYDLSGDTGFGSQTQQLDMTVLQLRGGIRF